jgi:hypothetical protein
MAAVSQNVLQAEYRQVQDRHAPRVVRGSRLKAVTEAACTPQHRHAINCLPARVSCSTQPAVVAPLPQPFLTRVGLHAPALIHGSDGQVNHTTSLQQDRGEVPVLAVRVPAGSTYKQPLVDSSCATSWALAAHASVCALLACRQTSGCCQSIVRQLRAHLDSTTSSCGSPQMPAAGIGSGSHPLVSWVVVAPGLQWYALKAAFQLQGPGMTPLPWSTLLDDRGAKNAPSKVEARVPVMLPSTSLRAQQGTQLSMSVESRDGHDKPLLS